MLDAIDAQIQRHATAIRHMSAELDTEAILSGEFGDDYEFLAERVDSLRYEIAILKNARRTGNYESAASILRRNGAIRTR